MRNNFLVAIAMLILFVTSCKKDEKLNLPENHIEQSSSPNRATLIEEAYAKLTAEEKKFFEHSYLSSFINSAGNVSSTQETIQAGKRDDWDSVVQKIMEEILILNAKDEFVTNLNSSFGFPAWDIAKGETTTDDEGLPINIIHIPFAFTDGTELTAYLLATVNINQEIEFALITRNEVDPILATNNIDFDIAYHVSMLMVLENSLFGKINEKYHKWLELFLENNLQEPNVNVRGCSAWVTHCWDQGPIAFQDPNQVSVREWVCVDMWVYFEDCPGGGGGGASSGGGGSIGNGSTGTSSGGIGGGSSSSNENNNETPTFENILEFCGLTGDEGPGQGYELTELEMKACDALNYLENDIEFPQENINYLTDIDNMSLLIQVANYIQNGGAYELSLATDYIAMLDEGTTSLGFKEFKKLYKLVIQELKPILNSNEAEDAFLLENPNVANQVKEFLDENPDLDVANFEVINGVAFLVDSDGVLHIFIEPLDMYQSNDIEKLNHVLNVLNLVKIYHCEYDIWYPIDWTDYLVQTTSPHFVVEWGAGPPNYNIITIGMNLNFTLASQPEHYLMGTSPDHHYTVTGTGQYKFAWNRLNTSIPMLSITVPEIHTSEIEAILYPSECD